MWESLLPLDITSQARVQAVDKPLGSAGGALGKSRQKAFFTAAQQLFVHTSTALCGQPQSALQQRERSRQNRRIHNLSTGPIGHGSGAENAEDQRAIDKCEPAINWLRSAAKPPAYQQLAAIRRRCRAHPRSCARQTSRWCGPCRQSVRRSPGS